MRSPFCVYWADGGLGAICAYQGGPQRALVTFARSKVTRGSGRHPPLLRRVSEQLDSPHKYRLFGIVLRTILATRVLVATLVDRLWDPAVRHFRLLESAQSAAGGVFRTPPSCTSPHRLLKRRRARNSVHLGKNSIICKNQHPCRVLVLFLVCVPIICRPVCAPDAPRRGASRACTAAKGTGCRGGPGRWPYPPRQRGDPNRKH